MDNLVHLTWTDPEHLQILLNPQIRYNYICVFFYNKDLKAKSLYAYPHLQTHMHAQTHPHPPKGNGTEEKGVLT